ncbi:2-phospho-L-lactate guanylyltransferase [Nocardioides sp. SYSU D00038]|uniref:2-phospho-L-lactate guanylyltransferase n=1 Tax=Nocardioides sp. SYSU D00038 TaxID=2812554 RepID=UPI00196831DB|nr:2-phospho-L-lactate guanylyltransferase [Nocardioides sp. SYSU D00038]
MTELSRPAARFAVVVPVKPPSYGKSRLGVDDEARRDLAAAFALDTLAACLSSDRVAQVLVATDDVGFAGELVALGCVAIPDGVSSDLNGTLRQAAAESRRRWPGLVPVALCADLPALRAADLDAALDHVGPGEAAYVADAAGIGTTLYTAAHDGFDPRFGPGSALAHEATGARPIAGDLITLRRDVDDLDDLRAALALGVGPRTRQQAGLLAETGLLAD